MMRKGSLKMAKKILIFSGPCQAQFQYANHFVCKHQTDLTIWMQSTVDKANTTHIKISSGTSFSSAALFDSIGCFCVGIQIVKTAMNVLIEGWVRIDNTCSKNMMKSQLMNGNHKMFFQLMTDMSSDNVDWTVSREKKMGLVTNYHSSNMADLK